METVIVRLKHEKAKQLLKDLEESDLIELKEKATYEEQPPLPISSLKDMMKHPMDGDAIDEQLKKLREE